MSDQSLDLLVTAANSDIGSAVVSRLASNRSSRLVITSRQNTDRLKNSYGPSVAHLKDIDLTLESDTAKVAAAVNHVFDMPFCWLHCAGDFWDHKSIDDTVLDVAKNMIASHYISLYAVAKVIVPIMKTVGGGRVLAFSCNSVRHSYPQMAAFTPAKAAVESFVKCLANEALEHNILANCFALPTIATPKVLNSKAKEYHTYYPSVESLVDSVLHCFSTMSPLITGNAIGIVKYSPYFHREGYFRRNRPKDT